MSILTVEDQFLTSEYLGRILEDAGYEVVATSNADEAIAILKVRSDIQIIITDIQLPGSMDGLKFAAAVRERWPAIKFIVTTGDADPVTTRCQSKVNSYPNRTCRMEFLRPFEISTYKALASAFSPGRQKDGAGRTKLGRTNETPTFFYDPGTLNEVAQTAGSKCSDRREITPFDRGAQTPRIRCPDRGDALRTLLPAAARTPSRCACLARWQSGDRNPLEVPHLRR